MPGFKFKTENPRRKNLQTDEDEDDRQRRLQVFELVNNRLQQEIQSPQAEDGENVAGIDDKHVLSDKENRGDAVQREKSRPWFQS